MQDFNSKVNNLIITHFFKKPDIKPHTYSFSESGTDALLVAEELQRREGVLFIVNANDEKNGVIWVVGNNSHYMIQSVPLAGRMPENDSFAAKATTMPLAMCLAALKSIGVDAHEGA